MRKLTKEITLSLCTIGLVITSHGSIFANDRYDKATYKNVGYISIAEETGPNYGIGTISNGAGDAGGKSYGLSQFTSRAGGASANTFISWLKEKYPHLSKHFEGAGEAGTKSFDEAWTKTTEEFEYEFGAAQLEYTALVYREPLRNLVKKELGIDLNATRALQEFAYSSSVQFGPQGTLEILQNAGVNASMTELEILERATAEKIRSVGTYKFLGCDKETQESVKLRFARELIEFKKIINGTANIVGFGANSNSIFANNINYKKNEANHIYNRLEQKLEEPWDSKDSNVKPYYVLEELELSDKENNFSNSENIEDIEKEAMEEIFKNDILKKDYNDDLDILQDINEEIEDNNSHEDKEVYFNYSSNSKTDNAVIEILIQEDVSVFGY